MRAGLVPVKRLDAAKGRLAPHFDAEQRVEIARALLEDAFELCASAGFLSWWVVSDDPDVLEAAARRRLSVVADAGAGLNAALGLAAATVGGAGARSVTVLPVDVPLATRADLEDVVDTGADSDLVVVPSRGDGGTNTLHLSPPDLLEPRFGPGSFAAHVDVARRRSLRCSILIRPRLALDIDTLADVDAFLARRPSGRAAQVLSRLRARARVP